ncbi:MAG: hypothetical protein NC204_05070 [Candidatus Amulumruptor caecigallinarius]|nr:hypothetical protein [Candidatus Amulumruptor caecigallinarius]
MDTNEKRERDLRNERLENEAEARYEAEHSLANGKRERNKNTRKVNSLWLWLGVIILIFILFWWLYSIGTFEALTGVSNG